MDLKEYLIPRNMIRKSKIHLDRMYRTVFNAWAQINPNPIFILGNQKSGTSAIAALLAHHTGLSLTLDMETLEHEANIQLIKGEITLQEFINQNRVYFSRQIIKEPWLTFHFDRLYALYPDARYVFIVRDPRNNIRSILNRLNLPGNLEDITEDHLNRIKAGWRIILRGTWMGLPEGTYIETLAYRWNTAVDVYLNHRSQMIFVRYEDFVKDKVNFIKALAEKLSLEGKRDFTHLIHKPFQPRGNSSVPLMEFFGEKNLHRILEICGSRMEQLNYL